VIVVVLVVLLVLVVVVVDCCSRVGLRLICCRPYSPLCLSSPIRNSPTYCVFLVILLVSHQGLLLPPSDPEIVSQPAQLPQLLVEPYLWSMITTPSWPALCSGARRPTFPCSSVTCFIRRRWSSSAECIPGLSTTSLTGCWSSRGTPCVMPSARWRWCTFVCFSSNSWVIWSERRQLMLCISHFKLPVSGRRPFDSSTSGS